MDSLLDKEDLESLHSNLESANDHIKKLQNELSELRKKSVFEKNKSDNELKLLQERYERLMSSHQRLSKLNHELEGKLLDAIEEKSRKTESLSDELNSVKELLKLSEQSLESITNERDRFKEDCLTAVKLLQSNPGQFLPQLQKTELPSSELIKLNKLSFGDCSQSTNNSANNSSSLTSIFPTFGPTFPPIGFFTSLQMQSDVNPDIKTKLNTCSSRTETNGTVVEL